VTITPKNLRIIVETCCDTLLNCRNPRSVRISAAEALGKLGSEEAILVLREVVLDDTDSKVRIAAINALVLIASPKSIQTMSEVPKYDLRGANIGNFAETVQGNQIATQNINTGTPEMTEAIATFQQILQDLHQKHPAATEAQAPLIMRAELEEIKRNQPNRWVILRRDLFNRERWFQGGKAAVTEVVKHLTETNVFAKGAIAFLEGFSGEVESN
jgi:hypothetical protein